MLHDEHRLFDKTGRSFIITHNLKGRNIKEWENQFKENDTYRKQKRKKKQRAANILVRNILEGWKERRYS